MEKNEVVRDPAQGEIPFRAYMETGSVPGYGSNGACTADTAEERRLYADGAQTGRADAGAGTTGVRYVTETER